MLSKLLQAWDQHNNLLAPPPEPIKLFQSESVIVYIESTWGPPIPYPPARREDGNMNHGYISLKGNMEAVATIPEVDCYPEYRLFLERINATSTPIESVGCEKSYFPCDRGNAKIHLGSYTDLIYSSLVLNDDPINFLRLAAALAPAMHNSKQWWSTAEMALQRSKGILQCAQPWCFMLRVSGHGRNEKEARQSWEASIDRIGHLITTLPSDFPQD